MPKSTVTVRAFIKAIDKDYFDAFLNCGEICMNSLKTFRDFEMKNEAIGDKYEGANYAICEGATISIGPPGTTNQFETLSENVKDVLFFNNEIFGNILSLYTIIYDGKDIHNIPQKFLQEFNNHRFCLITAPNYFIEKLKNAILSKGFKPEARPVHYFAPTEKLIALNPFMKRENYNYQNETRVYFKNIIDERHIFKIGSIHEYAIEIFPKQHIYKLTSSRFNDLIIKVENNLTDNFK